MTLSTDKLIQVVFLAGALVLGCSGQWGGGTVASNTMATNTMATGYGAPHLPGRGLGGFFDPIYQRPPMQTGYSGYSQFSTVAKSSASNSEEVLDNAQKMAMQPINSVMSSLPAEAQTVQPNPQLARSSTHQDNQQGSDDYKEKCSARFSGEGTDTQQPQPEEQTGQVIQDGHELAQVGGQEPSKSPCFCPCMSYLGWVYGAYPYANPSHYTNPVHYVYSKNSDFRNRRSSPYGNQELYRMGSGYQLVYGTPYQYTSTYDPYQESRRSQSQQRRAYDPYMEIRSSQSQQSRANDPYQMGRSNYPYQQQYHPVVRTYWMPYMNQNSMQGYPNYPAYPYRMYSYGRYQY